MNKKYNIYFAIAVSVVVSLFLFGATYSALFARYNFDELDFGDECLPGICEDDEDNPYLDDEDILPRENLSRDNLPNDELPRTELPREEFPTSELPREELPQEDLPRSELPRVEFPVSELPQDEFLREEEEDTAEFEEPEEEILLTALEQLEQTITEEAEQELQENLKQQEEEPQTIEKIIQQTPAFKEIIPSVISGGDGGFSQITDANKNGVPDNIEQASGGTPTKIDPEIVQFRVQLSNEEKQLVQQGKSQKEARQITNKKLKKKKSEKKQTAIRKVASKKYNIEITNSRDDENKDGISDEVEVVLGLDPGKKVEPKTNFSPAEKIFYGISETRDPAVTKKCTMNLNHGDKLSAKGFTVLAACQPNKRFTLYAVDKKGKETAVATKTSSGNSKLVFAVNKKFVAGKYIFKIKPAKQISFWPLFTAYAEDADESSDPALVDVSDDADIAQPIIEKVENIDVSKVKDIKIESTPDGKIRVSGITDIDTMVVGTFESAVFTSALLADVDNGAFEIISSRPLEPGQHEVSLYATRPEDKIQSPPSIISFSIIPTAKAATEETVATRPAAEEERPVEYGIFIIISVIIMVTIAITKWKKDKRQA